MKYKISIFFFCFFLSCKFIFSRNNYCYIPSLGISITNADTVSQLKLSVIDSLQLGLKPKAVIMPLATDFVVSKNNKTINKTLENKNTNTNLIQQIIKKNADSLMPIIGNAQKFKLQIIFTQINRDKNNMPTLIKHEYLVDEKKYFYPASLVKLPLCALALQKLNQLNADGLNMNTPMFTDALPQTCQTKTFFDSTAYNNFPSIEHYIKKMLLVSDNNAYSRIFEFLGQDYIHNSLSKINLSKIVIRHRFDAKCSPENNSITNPIYFQKNTNYFFAQPAMYAKIKYAAPIAKPLVGKANISNDGKKIMKPKNFATMNYFRLQDVDDVLKRLIFPMVYSPENRFNLTQNNYTFLRKYMSMLPRESNYPTYNDSLYEDSYKKYLLYGNVHGVMQNDSVRIFNIVGQSYGFLADCAYIINAQKGIEFFVSAVIYVNEDGVVNDGIYEYKSIGFPFLSKLGMAFYNYESNRKKEIFPKLNEFIFDYK